MVFNWGDRIYSQRKAKSLRQKNQEQEQIKELIYRTAMTSFVRSGSKNIQRPESLIGGHNM
jgi:hypothetical protein